MPANKPHNKLTQSQFLDKARAVHGNLYDYGKTVYSTIFSKIIITCREHGDFTQKPANHVHLQQGCPECKQQGLLLSKEEIRQRIDKFVTKYGGKFDPSPFESIIRYKDSVTLECPDHGAFKTNMNTMLHPRTKYGCPKCGNMRKGSNKRIRTIDEFISAARVVHGDRYSYEKTVYTGSRKNIEIVCAAHGSFFQTPRNHLSGTNCPKCARFPAVSKEETDLREALSNYLVLRANDRWLISPLELDIVCPDYNLAVEFCGIYWHSDGKNTPPDHHYRKLSLSTEKGYRLYTVFSDEWKRAPDAVLSNILRGAGKLKKVQISSCDVRPVPSEAAKHFYLTNSVMLPDRTVRGNNFGFYLGEDLLAVATVAGGIITFNARQNFLDLSGGIKEFIGYVPGAYSMLIDLRWDNLNQYVSDGMKVLRQDPPSFYYTRGGIRKDNDYVGIENCLGIPVSSEVMREKGWFRIYDCGSALVA